MVLYSTYNGKTQVPVMVTQPVLTDKLSDTFRVHVQAVGFAAVVGGHVMVADGDVEGVTTGDVVTQRLPVHRDQTRPGLSDLQPLGSPHGFCRQTEEHIGKGVKQKMARDRFLTCGSPIMPEFGQ